MKKSEYAEILDAQIRSQIRALALELIQLEALIASQPVLSEGYDAILISIDNQIGLTKNDINMHFEELSELRTRLGELEDAREAVTQARDAV